MDPAEIVRRGYDRLGRRYLDTFTGDESSPRRRFVDIVRQGTGAESTVLDLGCGPGYPASSMLADHCRVVAVDVALTQLKLARVHAPRAILVQADMARLRFAPASFDAVVAFYSLIHVPRYLLYGVLSRIERWLRPGGILVATLGAGDLPDSIEDGWLGVPMFFSHFAAPTNTGLVSRAGLIVESDEILSEIEPGGHHVSFQWIVARKRPLPKSTLRRSEAAPS